MRYLCRNISVVNIFIIDLVFFTFNHALYLVNPAARTRTSKVFNNIYAEKLCTSHERVGEQIIYLGLRVVQVYIFFKHYACFFVNRDDPTAIPSIS